MPAVHAKPEASWGEPSSPSAAVDNGTSAWGKPPSSGTGWGDNSAESAGPYGRVSAPAAAPALCKPGKICCSLIGLAKVEEKNTPAFTFFFSLSRYSFMLWKMKDVSAFRVAVVFVDSSAGSPILYQ